jgi:peptidoglycan/LPS O-acetylase OafA/YrhL
MKPALTPLTSLRFFAAAAVVTCHRPRSSPDAWLPYERFGLIGVPFFFLLSGFILAYTYHDRLLARRPGALREFLVARVARIYPAYLLAFLFSLWLWPAGRDVLHRPFSRALWLVLSQLTMTQALIPNWDYYFGGNAPGWSLSCEWTFYLLFPVLLLGLATGSVRRRVAVFAAASAVWAVALYLYMTHAGNPEAQFRKWFWLVYIFPLARVFDFVCGVALGVAFVRAAPAVGPASGRGYWAWGLVELGAVAVLWAALHFCPVSPGAHGGGATFRIHILSAQGYFLPPFALLVWVGAVGRGPLSSGLRWSPLVYLGEISYGLYILQAPVFVWTWKAHTLVGRDPQQVLGVTIGTCIAALLVVSVLSHHLWETPVRRWVRGSRAVPVPVVPLPVAPEPTRRAA